MNNNECQYNDQKTTTIADKLIILVSVFNLFFLIFTSSFAFNEMLASLCARGLMLINIIFFVMFTIKNIRHAKKNYLLFLILAFSLGISYLLSPQGGLGNFFINLCSYLAVPIYMLVIPAVKVSDKTRQWLKKISVCYVLFFIVAYLYNPTILAATGALTLGFSNPNTAGMYMYLTAIFLLLAFQNCGNKYEKLLSYGLVIILDYLIAQTQCRTAFLLTLFCLICAIFPNFFHPKKKFAVACVLSPIIFYYLYMYLYKMSWNLDFTILGRTIYSGRQEMFMLQGMDFSLFGNYAQNFEGLNVALAFVNTVGVFGLCAFIIYSILFMLSPFVQNSTTATSNSSYLKLICIGTIFIYGCVEVALVTGGSVFAGLIGCAMATIKEK